VAAATAAATQPWQVAAAEPAPGSPSSSSDESDDQPWLSPADDQDDPAELALQEVHQEAASAVQTAQEAAADAAAAAPASAAQDDQPWLTATPVLDDPAELALQEVMLPLGTVDEQDAPASEPDASAATDADADAAQTSSTIVAEADSNAAASDAAGSAPADAASAAAEPAPSSAAPAAVLDVEVVDSDPMWQTMPDLSQMKKTSVFGSMDSVDADDVEGFTLPTGSKAGDILSQISALESADLEVDVMWEEEDRPGILKRVGSCCWHAQSATSCVPASVYSHVGV
jgi:hypothetical protein